ncbi:MAG: hypothetical protein P1P83_05485 [Bacteroidales bacterium]|nr:hypothetical protein [Bacteroidales bacterium]MDT8374283.1 hypothetical protein [Bacteroidales bacterium]
MTKELDSLKPGDELIVRDVWGAITYRGKGVFIAGGAGITPFISIFRDLQSRDELEGNMLIFANKTEADIIQPEEFRKMLGDNFINILSEEKLSHYHHGMISEEFLRSIVGDFNRQFYLCGPPPMMNALKKQLANLGIEKESLTVEF